MFSCFIFSPYIRFFVNVLIEMNVNISDELNFSDVYRSVTYIESGFIHFVDKPQKNEFIP